MGQGVLPVMMKPILMALLFISASLAGCLSDDETSSSAVEAIFDYEPDKNIRTDADIDFDAGASLPSGVTLTYKWDFDNDGDYDETGRTAIWSYPEAGEYEVTLTVTDSTNSDSQTRSITIIDADAVEPNADAGSAAPSSDCEGESVSSGSYYIAYICEMDKSLSSKNILATTTVTLDGSDSEPCSDDDNCDEYISSWKWDLDLLRDEDGDGDFKNDADLTGETVDWKDIELGEYKIALTVTNGAGLTSTDETLVYVNYIGKWSDFSIAGNTSNNAVEIDFTFPVTYDLDTSNTVNKVVGDLVYPQEDSDCIDTVPGEESNCRAKIDLFSYNSTDEKSLDTSGIDVSTREYGCDSDNDCVSLTLRGSCQFASSDSADEEDQCYKRDGQWTISVHNEMVNDLDIDSLTITIRYK